MLGAGNGGAAAAADLARRGFSVRLWGRTAARLHAFQERGGVEYAGAIGDGFAPLALITDNASKAIAGADLVLSTVPTHGHESLAAQIAPHLESGQLFMAAPGHTLLLIPTTLRRHGVRNVIHCETGTLPYICRMETAVRVRITQPARSLAFAVFPGRLRDEIAARVRPVLPAIAPVASVLETVFPYTNAIHHPPATLMNAGRIEATSGDYYHYYDGITPAVGRVIDRLDEERLAIASALGCEPPRFVEHFYRLGYTTEAARQTGLAYEAFHQSEPDRWIRAPASLDYRFLDEDVPYGLLPLAALGRYAGVATPVMDHLIHLAEVATGKDYRASGLTLARMGLADIPRARLGRVLEDGFDD